MISEKVKWKQKNRREPETASKSNRIYKEDKEGETVFGEREDKDTAG